MNKIPVGQTIRLAYAFTFGEIGTVIGLTWIPTLILAVANFFVLRAYYPALADAIDTGSPPSGAVAMLPLALIILTMFTFAMIGVALTQQVLGLRKGPAFAHVSLGSAEFKVFGGYFVVYVLLTLFVLLFMLALSVLVSGAIAAIRASAAAPAAGFGLLLLCLTGLCAAIYAATRLSFLLVPTVLDGADFGVIRSWQLTKGNFWRIFAIGLATLLPLFLIVDVISSIVLGPAALGGSATPPATMAEIMHRFAAELRSMPPHLPILVGVSLVMSPLTYSLLFTPAAFAYRALTGKTAFAAGEKN